MAGSRQRIVYVDTNVVIEATRTKCWKALIKQCDVHTVTAVREESAAGKKGPGYVAVDMTEFDACVAVHPVTDEMALGAATKVQPGMTAQAFLALDRGERDLLAWVSTIQDKHALILTTADGAAVKAACALSLSDNLYSLEELARKCGLSPKLNEWHGAKWLSARKTEFILGTIG